MVSVRKDEEVSQHRAEGTERTEKEELSESGCFRRRTPQEERLVEAGEAMEAAGGEDQQSEKCDGEEQGRCAAERKLGNAGE